MPCFADRSFSQRGTEQCSAGIRARAGGSCEAGKGGRAGHLPHVRTSIRGAATHLQREEHLQGRGGLPGTLPLQQSPHHLPFPAPWQAATHPHQPTSGLTGKEQGLLEPDPRAGVPEDGSLLQSTDVCPAGSVGNLLQQPLKRLFRERVRG